MKAVFRVEACTHIHYTFQQDDNTEPISLISIAYNYMIYTCDTIHATNIYLHDLHMLHGNIQ